MDERRIVVDESLAEPLELCILHRSRITGRIWKVHLIDGTKPLKQVQAEMLDDFVDFCMVLLKEYREELGGGK